MIEKRNPKVFTEGSKYCPGCGHGIVNRLLAEVLEEMGLTDNTALALAVGCCGLLMYYYEIDMVQAPHGRASAVAVGMKRVRPETCIIAFHGDGDALAIGFSETMYAAIRNENIFTIIVNNGVFGMTGGQMSPTTLPGQKTVTSPKGRDPEVTGAPVNVINFMKQCKTGYLARGALYSAKEINKVKQYIRTGIENQMSGKGFSLVEILSPCPTNWHMTPLASMEHIKNTVQTIYPLGEFVKNGEKVNA